MADTTSLAAMTDIARVLEMHLATNDQIVKRVAVLAERDSRAAPMSAALDRITAALLLPYPATPDGYAKIADAAVAKIEGAASLNSELNKRSALLDAAHKDLDKIAKALDLEPERMDRPGRLPLAGAVCTAVSAKTNLKELVHGIIAALGMEHLTDPVNAPAAIRRLRTQLEDTQRKHAQVVDDCAALRVQVSNVGVSLAEDRARVAQLEQQVDTLIRLLDMSVTASVIG